MRKYRFPERNRIIAGLARSCVVIEAPEHSGALITADHALTEGRDVFVHAECLAGSRDKGAADLASQGAGIVNNAEDILADWRAAAPTAQE
jgi:DNA processing protein